MFVPFREVKIENLSSLNLTCLVMILFLYVKFCFLAKNRYVKYSNEKVIQPLLLFIYLRNISS